MAFEVVEIRTIFHSQHLQRIYRPCIHTVYLHFKAHVDRVGIFDYQISCLLKWTQKPYGYSNNIGDLFSPIHLWLDKRGMNNILVPSIHDPPGHSTTESFIGIWTNCKKLSSGLVSHNDLLQSCSCKETQMSRA